MMDQKEKNPVLESAENQVIDFSHIRKLRLEEKTRSTERVLFRNLFQTYKVDSYGKLCPIEILNLSAEGCSFQMPLYPIEDHPKDTERLGIRLYLSQNTYLEVLCNIRNSHFTADESGQQKVRFGCQMLRETQSYVAYELLVRFLKVYSEISKKEPAAPVACG